MIKGYMIKCILKQQLKSFEVLNRKFSAQNFNEAISRNFNRMETICCKLICLMRFPIFLTDYVKDYATVRDKK